MAVCLVHVVNIISNASLFAKVLKVSKEFNFIVWALNWDTWKKIAQSLSLFF